MDMLIMERNPNWSRDELIVALDFYLRFRPTIPSKQSPEIGDLSASLNRLQMVAVGARTSTFRNANGVYMKLMNFRRFDPDYKGSGLQRGNRDERAVWDLYASRPTDLRLLAETIAANAANRASNTPFPFDFDDEMDAEEGRILSREHRIRERDPNIVALKRHNS
jgi:5-methylcytosine-specific restriction protein A